ncbi:hypothetical protein ACONUD_01685 [Microbulbifer harenosus]|uniref:Shikimate kinase n=1 Tax=Microbulbifer harenosus TaxID=2576840 RepID=A0ABY2UMS0_9GAMM|nr:MULTISPECIES: hypothetical protein [Microbulbifer]QIL89769.1 hypothetical protein GNX18_08405 [Microbulbifer sp. SH-1]TLM79606.1 hypothetical protein FDY93_01675 [Microbulbifer harenosus]
MTEVVSLVGISVNRYTLFKLFKYTVYCLLAYNVYAFFVENHVAAGTIFADGVSLGKIIEAYNDSIDTLAWVLLLMVFELETWVLSDARLKGGTKWLLNAVSAFCYVFIVYSFYGYVSEMVSLTHLLPMAGSACDVAAGGGWSVVLEQDDYTPLTVANCGSLADVHLLRLADAQIVGDASVWREIQWLAWVDVINAGAWLLVVAILAFDVWLQLRHELSDAIMRYSQIVKGLLYFTLLICAIYWGYSGSLLEFWDAFLWLVAFFFIEMNLFEWQAETSAE